MVAGVNVGEGCKKAAREETIGPQEMEELPWGPEAVRPYQALFDPPPGVGASCGHDPSL